MWQLYASNHEYVKINECFIPNPEARGSFREIAKIISKDEKKDGTIHVRYYERKKKLKNIMIKQPNYNLRNIIADYYLAPVLEQYVKIDTEDS